MNLHRMLLQRASEGRPVRVALIGAGKFGTMFIAQARTTVGLHLAGIADLRPEVAKVAFAGTGWPAEQCDATSVADAIDTGRTFVTDDAMALIEADRIDVVIDATGSPRAGIRHARACAAHGKHIVMVNVEADVLAGPLLAREAQQAGVVYTLAYGDQPALICELVDWARACGFDVVAAGKGTKYEPHYHASTPETVWDYFGLTAEEAARGGMNSKMFNSFIDGTKSGVEMCAVSNATGLTAAPHGLTFPPVGTHYLTSVLRPAEDGGQLHHKGQVEVISSQERDGSLVHNDLRVGVYVVFEANTDYVKNCFYEYGLAIDSTGKYAAMYKPYHLIGLELGISVASAALRGEPTGAPDAFRSDVAATAKRDLKAGEMLDGEGGYTVWGKLMPAEASLRQGALPMGLADGVKLLRDIKQGEMLCWADVEIDEGDDAVKTRRAMEQAFAPTAQAAAE